MEISVKLDDPADVLDEMRECYLDAEMFAVSSALDIAYDILRDEMNDSQADSILLDIATVVDDVLKKGGDALSPDTRQRLERIKKDGAGNSGFGD